jgi:hypothetical protein
MGRPPTLESKVADEQQKETSEIYEIRLQGHLDAKGSSWFCGITITYEPDGTTKLCGSLPDQIVLHSVLDRIRDMNLPLISVNPIVADRQTGSGEVKGVSHDE